MPLPPAPHHAPTPRPRPPPAGPLAREDALALSRLYAVRVLAGACGAAAEARAWLEGGGAGLGEAQRRLLLAELSGAEAAAAGGAPLAPAPQQQQQPQQLQPQQRAEQGAANPFFTMTGEVEEAELEACWPQPGDGPAAAAAAPAGPGPQQQAEEAPPPNAGLLTRARDAAAQAWESERVQVRPGRGRAGWSGGPPLCCGRVV